MVDDIIRICIAVAALVFIVIPAYADFDVNAVAGTVTVDGEPAPGGLEVIIENLESGEIATTSVDGPNVPPFLYGRGAFDSGDLPALSTGDTVRVYVSGLPGSVQVTLSGGTTRVKLTIDDLQQQSSSDPEPASRTVASIGLKDGGPGDLHAEDLAACADMILERTRSAVELIRQGTVLLVEKMDNRLRGISEELDSRASQGRKEFASVTISYGGQAIGLLILMTASGAFFAFARRVSRERIVRETRDEGPAVHTRPFWDPFWESPSTGVEGSGAEGDSD